MVDEIPKAGLSAAHCESPTEAKGSNVVVAGGPPLADPETRSNIERKLKRKLDARCSVFVLIYVSKYLSASSSSSPCFSYSSF